MAGRILVVDDVATNRIVLKAKLAIACYDVLQAADGAQALEIARTKRPDLILLDMAMPGMSGLEVLGCLKADPATATIPVVVITSFADRRTKLAALRAGADDFLSKPVDDMVLTARVRSLLRDYALSEEFDLREGTRQALGFAEAQAGFAGPQGHGAQAAQMPPGRIALIGTTPLMAQKWRRALAGRLPDTLTVMDRAAALRLARNDRAAVLPDLPDVFVISADLGLRAEGLRLVSELRAHATTRQLPIVVILPEGAEDEMPMALDLGATDLQISPVDPEELALRLTRQMARKRAAEALREKVRDGLHLALTDPLTGLPNRRHALTHLEKVRARCLQSGGSFALLMLDLDRFKEVNDRYGHAAGDAVLQTMAGRLQGHLRPEDLLARIGGEEFLAILPHITADEARRTAERMRLAMEGMPITLPLSSVPVSGPGHGSVSGPVSGSVSRPGQEAQSSPQPLRSIRQTLSIGLVIGPHGSDDPGGRSSPENAVADLLDRADAALYRAKHNGRNRIATAQAPDAGEAAA